MRTKIVCAVLTFSILAGLLSCKNGSEEKVDVLRGKWDLILWENKQSTGTLVFKDSVMYFAMAGATEISRYSISGKDLKIVRIGGTMSHFSSYDNWTIEDLDDNFLKFVSKDGNIVTALKSKNKTKKKPNSRDTLNL